MKTQSAPRYKTPAPTRGGARPGAGRPKGSTTKVTLEDLVGHIEHHVGRSFAEQVAISYASAINRADHAGVRDYEKILLAKMVSDKTEVAVTESADLVSAKQTAFQEALAKLAALSDKAK